MSEHTCTAACNWGKELRECAERCAGCRAEYDELSAMEQRVLGAVRRYVRAALAGELVQHTRYAGDLFQIGKEYVALRDRVLKASKQ